MYAFDLARSRNFAKMWPLFQALQGKQFFNPAKFCLLTKGNLLMGIDKKTVRREGIEPTY
jgi:hypothetical protein